MHNSDSFDFACTRGLFAVACPRGLFVDLLNPILFIDVILCLDYQGCYKDRKPGRDLPRRFTRYAMTPEVCLRECKYQGYNFAGLQYSYLCFCGNAFGRYGKVDDAFCNSRCLGDKTRPCGAFWHNSVYSVGMSVIRLV